MNKENDFELLVPEKSCLGYQWHNLKEIRETEKNKFEKCADKMEAETHRYRCSILACDNFVEYYLPLIEKANLRADTHAKEAMEKQAKRAQQSKHGFVIDRRSERIIWIRFAIEQYRSILPHGLRPFIGYHPALVREIHAEAKKFWKEARVWIHGRSLWDGSPPMGTMFSLIVKCRMLGVAND